VIQAAGTIIGTVLNIALGRGYVSWVCPVCGSAEQVTPYEREYRIGHAEVCTDCRGDRV